MLLLSLRRGIEPGFAGSHGILPSDVTARCTKAAVQKKKKERQITIGILVANILNYFFDKIKGGWRWRLSLGGAVIPALIITVGSLFLPETPNSMIERGNKEKARLKLQRIRGVNNVDQPSDHGQLRDGETQTRASHRIFHDPKDYLALGVSSCGVFTSV
ncbi:hypothetical protein LXL04_036436 [Taraxacum kok-saghyz]